MPETAPSTAFLQHLRQRLSGGRELGAAALLLLLCVCTVGGARVLEGRRDAANARDARLTIDAERLLSALKDVETGSRGFLLTGDEAYLAPYEAAVPQIEAQLRAMSALGVMLDSLPEAVDRRIAMSATAIALRRRSGLAAAMQAIDTGAGKQAMDLVRAKVATLQSAADSRMSRRRRRQGATWLYGLGLASLAGAIIAVAAYARRRRRESRAASALLQDVLENAPIGIGLLDRTLHIRHMNRSLAAMGSRTLGAQIGSSLWEAMPELEDAFAGKLQRVLEGGRPIPNTEVTATDPARPDHTRQYLVSFYPVVAGAGMVVNDVTIRNRLERRMRESEARFRSLSENSAAIIWTTSPEGEFTTEQRQWMAFTGQDAAEAAGSGWAGAVHPEDQPHAERDWALALAGGHPLATEYRLRRADGEWRHMAVQAVPVRDEDGALREWVGSHTDITERRLAEAALAAARDAAEAANRAKSVFLANMSHELRTPLSAVIGYSEMLEEEMADLDQPHLIADLKKIETNARHLLSLINDVLDLSKIEANRMTSYGEDFDVATIAREAASTVGALVERKNNTLSLDLGENGGEDGGEGLGTMHSDVVKLRQCLFNLISNAAKFTENGRITLAVVREADWLVFSVADTGIGMTEEQVGRLFQRFSQADESTTRNFGGTGLGLALTRAFSRLLGGDVAVTSRLGEGTVFTLRLPAVMPEQAASEPEGDGHAAMPDGKQVVLVVDDDPAQRDLLTRFLTREGFAVATAADGRAGLEMARTLRPRAILLDVMMPQMDGWSVLSAIKADPELAPIPVVMASFVNEPALANALGAADYVLKPVEWDQLKTVMERFRCGEGVVLVVDDDQDARDRLRTVLERNGWAVQEASNGREALDAVGRAVPVVILLDLTMPVMDGFSFLQALRERPGGGDIPVIVLSARDLSEGDRDRLQSADRVLRKGDMDLRALPGQLAEVRDGHAGR